MASADSTALDVTVAAFYGTAGNVFTLTFTINVAKPWRTTRHEPHTR
jgi:hypothetical protein